MHEHANAGDIAMLIRPRVLLVDDNADAVNSLAALLRLLKYDVRAATSGFEALAAGAAHRPQVVVLDLGMPGMDGFDTARAIRATAWGAETRLLALTGRDGAEDRRMTAAAGFEAHLVKPLQIQELLDRLT
jgi:CheY-like chemotaxis protein